LEVNFLAAMQDTHHVVRNVSNSVLHYLPQQGIDKYVLSLREWLTRLLLTLACSSLLVFNWMTTDIFAGHWQFFDLPLLFTHQQPLPRNTYALGCRHWCAHDYKSSLLELQTFLRLACVKTCNYIWIKASIEPRGNFYRRSDI